jgi:fructose-1,6-bisphosphatase
MKINELIRILQLAPDKERDVYTESVKGYYTTIIAVDFDQNNDIRLCEVVDEDTAKSIQKDFDLEYKQQIAEKYRKIEQIKKSISEELDKIANIEIDYA